MKKINNIHFLIYLCDKSSLFNVDFVRILTQDSYIKAERPFLLLAIVTAAVFPGISRPLCLLPRLLQRLASTSKAASSTAAAQGQCSLLYTINA